MSGQLDYTDDFISLAEAAGIKAPPVVFRIINELLAMQVAPEDIHKLLRTFCPLQQRREETGAKAGASSH